MKLKYYLRGAGVGVIITTLVLMIAFAFHKPEMSNEEVIAKAKTLGMVMAEDDSAKKEPTQKDASKTDETKEDNQENGTVNKQELVTFQVVSGESSAVISQHLQDYGLVDNGNAFDKFVSEMDIDNELQPGEFTIPKGSTFLEIAEILTTKK